MELTYEEKLQLENGKEHLQVVLGNIRIASGELTKIYELLAEAKSDISKANTDRERILRENSEALLGISLKQSGLDNMEKSLILRENSINEKEKDILYRINIANSKLEDINKNILISESNYGKLTTNKTGEITILDDKIRKLNYEITTLEKEGREKLGIKKKLENEVSGLNNQIEEAKKEFEKFKITAKAELASIMIQQQEEREKIKNPLDLIRRESEALEINRNDLAIIKARLTRQYKELNPDRVLPIELQTK